MGGHSLKAVRLSNEYQKEFAVKISLKDLFTRTSIEQQAELIRSSKKEEFIQIKKVAQQAELRYLRCPAQAVGTGAV